jgi:hypothetical protein
MLMALMNVLRPQISFKHEGERLRLSLEGCKTATISDLTVRKKFGDTWVKILDAFTATGIEGDLRAEDPASTALPLSVAVREEDFIKY